MTTDMLFDDILAKGLAVLADGRAMVAAWDVVDILTGDVSLPVAVLLESRIAHDLAWM